MPPISPKALTILVYLDKLYSVDHKELANSIGPKYHACDHFA
jgi:hypothetical protein